MPVANVGDVEIYYEELGPADGPVMVMVMGLGVQLIGWPPGFVQQFVDHGYRVIRFDNRDIGLSTRFDSAGEFSVETLFGMVAGQKVDVPYTLSDMAADAVGLLDHLGIESADFVGMSMGGMIVQTIAIEHPSRVKSLASISSTTGSPMVGQPSAEAMLVLASPLEQTRDGYIQFATKMFGVIGSKPPLGDLDWAQQIAGEQFDRGAAPSSLMRQIAAVLASGDRTEKLASVQAPTIVIHGTKDMMIDFSGGKATAAAIPNSELLEIEGGGHDFPKTYWSAYFDAIVANAAR